MGITASIMDHPLMPKVRRKKDKSVAKKTDFIEETVALEELIVKETGEEVFTYVKTHTKLDNDSCFVAKTTTRFNIDKLPKNRFRYIINLKYANDIRFLNKFFESVNTKLPFGGIYISSVEVYMNRKERILTKWIKPFNWMYYFVDTIYTRVFPKLPVTKKIYFYISKGKNRVLSRAETFGRLYSCGFEVIDQKFIGNQLYFTARKTCDPHYDQNPTYGAIIRLKRHGKGGKLFNVYKLRTMHAYSEYLQEYIFQQNNLKEGGKFSDDFRITTEGKFFRKFWLDELPMLINLFKGNMKLVGVRPLSKHYFSLYSEELRKKRIKFKPGLVPPYYVDNPKTLKEIMSSEMRYLDAYEKHPLKTDFVYFWKAFYNIIFKHARSG